MTDAETASFSSAAALPIRKLLLIPSCRPHVPQAAEASRRADASQRALNYCVKPAREASQREHFPVKLCPEKLRAVLEARQVS